MVYINIYEDITNTLKYYNLTFDDIILVGNSGGYIDKIKFIKLAQNTDYNDIENGNIIDIKMLGKNFIVRNVIKEYEDSAEYEIFWEVFYIEHLIKSTQELIIKKDNLCV